MTIIFHEAKGVVNSLLRSSKTQIWVGVDANQKPPQNPKFPRSILIEAFNVLIQMID